VHCTARFLPIVRLNLYRLRHPFAWDDWAMCIPGVLFIFGTITEDNIMRKQDQPRDMRR